MEKTTTIGLVLSEIEPPPGLYTLVLARIARARRRSARLQFIFQTGVFFVSGMLLVPLAQSIGQEFYTSGFYEYASLLFSSDTGIISNSSHELLYSLIESLPAFALLGTGVVVAALMWSLRRIIFNSKTVFRPITQLV